MSDPRPVFDVKLIETTITYLQMFEPPRRPWARPPRNGLGIVQAVRPTVSFYRYLYNTVGEPWLWSIRRKLSDEALAQIVQDDRVEVYVLYVEGVPAGYVELDRREPPDIELGYFGLIPQFIGQKLGPYLLDWAIERAWSYGPPRFWLHTCTLDHPKALSMYQQAGFVPYQSETKLEEDPRGDGWLKG